MGHFLCSVDNDVVKTVNFETETKTWLKLRDYGSHKSNSKIPRTGPKNP